jgi:hypothetical protein
MSSSMNSSERHESQESMLSKTKSFVQSRMKLQESRENYISSGGQELQPYEVEEEFERITQYEKSRVSPLKDNKFSTMAYS